jgi:ParB/RepB/Spo0J family partition protein
MSKKTLLNALSSQKEYNNVTTLISRKSQSVDLDITTITDFTQQPRHNIYSDEYKSGIRELAEDIKRNGLINPITVARIKGLDETGNDSFRNMLVAGSRRLAAVKMLNIIKVPSVVYVFNEDDPDLDKSLFLIADSENSKRKDLSPFENAESLYHMKNHLKMSVEDIAEIRSMHPESVKRFLSLVHYKDVLSSICREIGYTIYDIESFRSLHNFTRMIRDKKMNEVREEISNYFKFRNIEKQEIDREGEGSDVVPEVKVKPKLLPKVKEGTKYQGPGNILVDMERSHKLVIDCRKAHLKEYSKVLESVLWSTITYGDYGTYSAFVEYTIEHAEEIGEEITKIFEAKLEEYNRLKEKRDYAVLHREH